VGRGASLPVAAPCSGVLQQGGRGTAVRSVFIETTGRKAPRIQALTDRDSLRDMPVNNTLKELSEQLGLSPSTISRALNGHDLKRASTRARAERIRSVAAEMGYAPNSVARSLKTNHRPIIGLMLPDILNDYYATAATRVQETMAAAGYRVFLCVTDDDAAVEDSHERMLREERVAGIVVVPGPHRAQRRAHVAADGGPAVPVVELVRQSAGQTADAVLIDDVDAGYQGTEHLIKLGHRRIAVLTGPPSLSTSRQRLAGYRQALDAAGIAFDTEMVRSGRYQRDAARAATYDLLDREDRPTALIATSNELVVGALQALDHRGLQLPVDLSMVGFGNPDWFALLRPALTTVALPIDEMAHVAAQRLLARMGASEQGQRSVDTRPIVSRYQAHLIVRASTRALDPSQGG